MDGEREHYTMNKSVLMRNAHTSTMAATAALAAAVGAAATAMAEIRSGTISASETLSSLEVEGNLEITGEGVVITISSGAVSVGDGVHGARLSVTDGASLLVADRNDSAQSIYIGRNGGSGTLVVDGGIVDCYDICLANGASATDAATGSLVLGNGAAVSSKNSVILSSPADASTTAPAADTRATIVIGSGSTLSAWSLAGLNGCSNLVSFAGGTLSVAKVEKRGTGVLELTGTSPIRISQTFSPTVANGNIYLFDVDRYTEVGPVVLSGASGAEFALIYPTENYQKTTSVAQRDLVRFAYSGTTTLSSGTLTLTAASQLPKGGDVAIGAGAVLDINGNAQTVGELAGAGNLHSASTTTLSVGGSSGAFAGTVDVSAGTLSLKTGNARRHYKVVVSAQIDTGTDAFQFSEFALCNAKGERVNLTANLDGSPSSTISTIGNLFDGNPTTGIWLSKNSGPIVFTFSLAAETPVFGYLFAPQTDKLANTKAPGTWTIYASDTALAADADGWVEIASVSDFVLTGGNKGNKVGYGVTDGSMGSDAWKAYNNGVPLQFSAGSGTVPAFSQSAKVAVASGATLDLSGTATAVGRVAVDCTAGGGTITGGSLAANGGIQLTYSANRLPICYEVPLTVSPSVDPPAKLEGWAVSVNGNGQPDTTVRFAGGKFILDREKATVLYIR